MIHVDRIDRLWLILPVDIPLKNTIIQGNNKRKIIAKCLLYAETNMGNA